MAPRVTTIDPAVPFLPTLARAILDGTLVPGLDATAPLGLADLTVYVPTRRAARALAEALLAGSGTRALVLPMIRPLGDVDEDRLALADLAIGGLVDPALVWPPPVEAVRRRLELARLVEAFVARLTEATGEPVLIAPSAGALLALTADLEAVFDALETAGVPFDRLSTLVPERFDRYWATTLAFLRIAGEAWPARLAELERVDPASRRDALIRAEAARIRSGDGGPVIAAGSTGSVPATAELIAAIARRPDGAVVLPGLDLRLDEASFTRLQAPVADDPEPTVGHPQFGMAQLLAAIGVPRAAVSVLGATPETPRAALLSEALRPAATTELWRERVAGLDAGDALTGVTLVEAASEQEEAVAAALAIRDALEAPEARVALVTPDRILGRRVAAELGRFGITVDDSGGGVLADTAAGRLLRLLIDAVADDFAPVALMALIDHPQAAFGLASAARAKAHRALDMALRGPRPKPGLAGLSAAVTALADKEGRRPRPVDRIAAWEIAAAQDLIARMEAATAPLIACGPTLADLAEALGEALEQVRAGGPDLTADDDETDALLAELAEMGATLTLHPKDRADAIGHFLQSRSVRRAAPPDARVRVLGTFEARLLAVDRVVLGGLVEGTWPPATRADAWLSRPMRGTLGLELPERRIGLSAHDFAQLMALPDAVVTRAAKKAGVPTVASRFLRRLDAVAPQAMAAARARGQDLITRARLIDAAGPPQPTPRPVPVPPVEARPKRLSVTQVEHWLRDPYTIYARHILKLDPLPALEEPLGAADRGTLIHAALDRFTREVPGWPLPPDALDRLLAIGREVFAPLNGLPDVHGFWWPRFERIAGWFIDFEARRRKTIEEIRTEVKGELTLPITGFVLSARADRIELDPDTGFTVLDYKTGAPPSDAQVQAGFAPQLTLQAAIAEAGGFEGVATGRTLRSLVYVKLSGGTPPAFDREVKPRKGETLEALVDEHLTRFTGLVARFADPAQGYPSLVSPAWKNRYGDYDHLARVKEWTSLEGEDE